MRTLPSFLPAFRSSSMIYLIKFVDLAGSLGLASLKFGLGVFMGLFLERKYWLQIRHCGLYLFANSGQCKKYFNSFLFMGSGVRPQTVHCRLLFCEPGLTKKVCSHNLVLQPMAVASSRQSILRWQSAIDLGTESHNKQYIRSK